MNSIIHWIRLGLASPFLIVGLAAENLGEFITGAGNQLQDWAVKIEGDPPNVA